MWLSSYSHVATWALWVSRQGNRDSGVGFNPPSTASLMWSTRPCMVLLWRGQEQETQHHQAVTPAFKAMQDKEIPLNNKILTLIFNNLSRCCINRPGVMPCSLSVLFFFQSSSQTPLPSGDKCWEMKCRNAAEYPWRHSLVIANISPCICRTKATFQLFYQKHSLPRCSLRFLLLVTEVTIPTQLGAASLRPQKIKGFLATEPYYRSVAAPEWWARSYRHGTKLPSDNCGALL